MNHTGSKHDSGEQGPCRAAPAEAAAADHPINGAVVAVLAGHRVDVDRPAPDVVQFRAVPLPESFSKPRANVLLRCLPTALAGTGTVQAFIDKDLAYTGADPTIRAAFGGPVARGWRALLMPPLGTTITEALCSLLRLLESPIADQTRTAAATAADEGPPSASLGPLLRYAGEIIRPDAARKACDESVRGELADRLAVLVTRPAVPSSAFLWGTPGCGRDHLMLAACWPLIEAERAPRTLLRLSGARLAAGCAGPTDLDSVLMKLLGELAAADLSLVLVRDIDVFVSCSHVSRALLRERLERGLHLLATVSSPAFLTRIHEDEGLARRLVAVHLDELSRTTIATVLEKLAGTSEIPVAPAAIQVALNLAAHTDGDPLAASLGILGAGIARAAWRDGAELVTPDDIFDNPESRWPDGDEQEED